MSDEEDNECGNTNEQKITDEQLLDAADQFFDIFLEERLDPHEAAEDESDPMIDTFMGAPVDSSNVSELNEVGL